jgi:phage shock protein C
LLSTLLATPPPLSQPRSSPPCCLSAPQPAHFPLRNALYRKEFEVNDRFVLNRSQAKVMGVAAGLADWTGVDALLIRLGLVAALLLAGPVVILFYIFTGWLASGR